MNVELARDQSEGRHRAGMRRMHGRTALLLASFLNFAVWYGLLGQGIKQTAMLCVTQVNLLFYAFQSSMYREILEGLRLAMEQIHCKELRKWKRSLLCFMCETRDEKLLAHNNLE